MSHQHDVAVIFLELLESDQEPLFQFAANRCRRRSQFAGGKLPGQVEGRAVTELRCAERLLAVKAAPLGSTMPPMQIDHAIPGQVTQPEMKWHPGIGKVFLQSLVRLEQDILHHIAGINAPGDFSIQP